MERPACFFIQDSPASVGGHAARWARFTKPIQTSRRSSALAGLGGTPGEPQKPEVGGLKLSSWRGLSVTTAASGGSPAAFACRLNSARDAYQVPCGSFQAPVTSWEGRDG